MTESNEAKQPARSVLLAKTLDDLIRVRGYAGRRKDICKALDISEGLLSHYLNARAVPSFEKLLALASFFDVSLDFLVYGERSASSESSAVLEIATSVQQAMAAASNKAGRQLDFVSRISQQLFDQVATVAKAMAELQGDVSSGFLSVADAITFESHTRSMRIMTKLFQCDVQLDSGGVARPGPFLAAVVRNLKHGRRYQYLLCSETDGWADEVEKFRDLLRVHGVREEDQLQLEFRESPRELICSACLHELEIPSLRSVAAPLVERYREFIGENGEMAYISVQNQLAEGGLVLEPLYRDSVVRFFDDMWRGGKRV